MTIPQIVGLNLFAALVGFYLGSLIATRSMYRVNCSCHTPIRWALLKYAGISLIFTMMVLGSGCATIGDLESEIAARKAAAHESEKSMALENRNTNERINLYSDRWNDLEQRVKHLERIAAPKDPDGLAENHDLEFDALADKAAHETDAKFCLKGIREGDAFLMKVTCPKDCDELANYSSDLEMGASLRKLLFVEVTKCRRGIQDRAFDKMTIEESTPGLGGTVLDSRYNDCILERVKGRKGTIDDMNFCMSDAISKCTKANGCLR